MSIKTAKSFEEIDDSMLSEAITNDEYIKKFANTLMHLSNELAEVLDSKKDDEFDDRIETAEEYLPSIREFILKTTGL